MGRGSSKVGSSGGSLSKINNREDAYVSKEMTQLIDDVASSIRLTADNRAYAVSRLKQLADPGDQLIQDTGNGKIVYHKTANRGWVVYADNFTFQRTDSNMIRDIHDSSIVNRHKWSFKRKD